MIPNIDMAWVDSVRPYAQPVLFGVGAVGALLGLLLLWRFLRTGHTHDKLGKVAVFLATAFAMEGMFEVAHGPLGLNLGGSLVFCATFEIVMLHQGSLAAHKLSNDPQADIRRHMNFVWLVAITSGLVASTASNSPTEVVLRLVTPPLAAGIWYMSLYADKPTGDRQPSKWIWTPQRVGIHLGLVKPGAADDLAAVFRQRRVDRMVRLAGRIDTGWSAFAGRRELKLRRLAEAANEAMMAEAGARFQRGKTARERIFAQPDGALFAHPGDADAAHPNGAAAQPPRAPVTNASRTPARTSDSQVARPSVRRGQVVLRRPVSAPPANRDAALAQAVTQVLAQGEAVRKAARDAGVPESTLRTRLKQQPDINGHDVARA